MTYKLIQTSTGKLDIKYIDVCHMNLIIIFSYDVLIEPSNATTHVVIAMRDKGSVRLVYKY